MGMVALYGLSMGNNKTYQWVTAMVVNFFWNIFVESLIKVRSLLPWISFFCQGCHCCPVHHTGPPENGLGPGPLGC